ncbi:hypothetical protein OEZ71_09845 [Defluviimonas sp. WL0050]|uniref:Uncharacterized protein n=1 Tax=Albidovulum litorale TaxID=2984134 RepID=A0ABT2ZN78_9RHOB|nr:hypothetical protein [Defluviimonas sp. WL0050]MCV2872601.1 hypothetical protein [Defluviimonas sp. WL0050]
MRQISTSGKAYRLQGMIRASIIAEENETSRLFADGKGVTWVLEAAEELASQIINEVELMEMERTSAENNKAGSRADWRERHQ